MTLCQVYYMDVITYAGSVGGIIIITENTQLFQLANCHLCDVRHQVVGDTVGVLTNGTALACSDRVEVMKQEHVPFGICLLNVGQDLLQHGFGPAVRVGALSLGAFLCDGNKCGIAIYGSAGREDDALHAVFSHNIYQSQCTCNIVLVIFPGLLYGLADCLQSCKMDDCIDLLLAKDLLQCFTIQNVCLIKRNLFAGDGFYSGDHLLTCIAEIIQYNNIIACLL